MVQPSPDHLVLMAKKQNQINIQMHKEFQKFVELKSFSTNQHCESEMQGKIFWQSKEKDEKGECRYQNLACSKAGQIYLLKLYVEKVQIEQLSNFSKQK